MPIPKLYRQPKFVLLLLVLLFGVLVAGCWYGYQKQLKNLEKQLYELQHQLQTQRCMIHSTLFTTIPKRAFQNLLALLFLACLSQAQTIRYVKPNGTGDGSSWANASGDLQAMINASGTQQVWVAKGTYKPATDVSGNASPADPRMKTFQMKAGVKIYGGFKGDETDLLQRTFTVMANNKSILSGDLNGDDATTGNGENSYHVVFNDDNGLTTTNALLDGFTIKEGNANRSYPYNSGGGMYNDSSSPSLVNCSFSGNQTSAAGGGMYNNNSSSPSLVNCSFSGNQAGRGGGMFNDNSSPSLVNCSFSGNQAGVNGGGMCNSSSSPSLVNCSFSGNQASVNGGGMCNTASSSPSLVNCSFSGNQASFDGGGMYNFFNSSPSLKNCILWGNSSEVYNTSGSNPTYTSTLVRGLKKGGFQGTENPLFVNQPSAGLGTAGDLRLQPCSPVINAGNNADNSSSTDLDGNTRIFGTIIDLGAYEYQSDLRPAAITPSVTGSSNPTTCGGTEGSITLSGLLNSAPYSVTYKKNTTAVAATNFTSNGSGVLTLTGLGAGSYTDIVATYGTCVNNAATATTMPTLTDPTKPSLILSTIPAICAGTMSFAVPYTNPTQSPNNYSISGTGITPITNGNLSSPITVNLSTAAVGSLIPFTLTVKNTTTNCVSNGIMGSVVVNPQPVGPSLNVKTPNVSAVCFGTSVSATFNAGSEGVGCSDDYVVIIDGGSPVAYSSGSLVGATANSSVEIKGRGANCSSGCVTDYVTLASWTVNPLPTATISGTTTVCRNNPSPSITFTGANATAPYTFTYKINDGAPQTVTTTGGNSVTVAAPTGTAGTFVYSLISVSESSSTACSQTQTGSATVTVNPLPTATISGTTMVCRNNPSPSITFTGANATAPYTFTYKINDGPAQTVTTTSGNSVTVAAPTGTTGSFVYSLVSVSESSSTACSQTQTGSATVTVNPLPTATISGTTTVCRNNPSPSITFTGTNATAPYTFTYKINDGTPQTVTTTSGNSVTVAAPTGTVGAFVYSLVSVSESSSTACSQTQTGSATVTVNPLPTATISGTTTVCQNSPSPSITFTGANAAAPYTFTYKINDGAPQTVTTTSGNSVTVAVPTGTAGAFVYSLVSVSEGSSTACSQTQTGSVTVTVNPLPTATISGTTTVCRNSSSPNITFTGANATAPYTFTYKINDGAPQTVTTTSGNSVTVAVPTGTVGAFVYSLVSVSESSSTACSQTQTGSATVTVNPLPTATISGTTTVCRNNPSPSITFTGANATAPYTFTYKINDGPAKTVTTTSGNSTTVAAPTGTAGTFVYSLISVSESSSTACSQTQTGSVTVTVNPLPTATISGTTTVCQNSASPMITFTGANATAPYTFTYKINDGSTQTVTTTSGNSVTVAAPTGTVGAFVYSLVSVSESSSTACSQTQSGNATVMVQGKPTITLTTLQQTLNEGNSQTFCDTDANSENGLQFTVTGSCVVGSPVWRSQVGNSAWSNWSPSPPVSQFSNNQPHRYQAACDGSCPVTYTSPIELTINYRASIPQNVSMIADGAVVNAGETKEVCNIEGNTITFNVTCASGEMLLYSVDGGDYSSVVPAQLVDGQYHNYRVRCRKSDGTSSCVETESGVMRLRITGSLAAPLASLNVTSGCGSPVAFSGTANCGALTTIWYNASTNVALPTLPSQTPTETSSYYARCQAGGGCLSEKSNVVTYTVLSVGVAPAITVSQEIVCTGTTVRISANCPAGSTTFWNTGVTAPSFEVAFNNVTKQTYWAKCLFEGGCQSSESIRKDIYWNAFVVSLINIGQSKSAVKTNDPSLWRSQFITRDGGADLEQSTQTNPTLYYVENANKTAPRYWTINVDACALGTNGSLTFDLLATPETGVPQSFNTHENNAPYFMYANREGWTELYAQNHPAYGFYQDNGLGGNVYDAGLPKGLYKLGIRYWDQKGWGSVYPSTRKPQGNVLAYQEYWFRIQSRDGVGVGAARTADSGQQSGVSEGVNDKEQGENKGQGARGEGADNGKQLTDNGAFATVLPNPVTSILRLQVQDSKGQEVQAELLDATGRRVLRRTFVAETPSHLEEYEISDLPNGAYFLHVRSELKQQVLKVVKIK